MTLKKWWQIAKRTKRVYYVTEHYSRSGMGASYSLFVIYKGQLEKAWPNEPEAGDSWGYSAKLARKLGFRLTRKWRAFYRGGCGYNKPHDVVYSIAQEFNGRDGLKLCNSISIEGLNSEG